MLSRRILTALVLVPLLIAALFYFPTSWVALLFGIFISLVLIVVCPAR